jgi:hypothetical protein
MLTAQRPGRRTGKPIDGQAIFPADAKPCRGGPTIFHKLLILNTARRHGGPQISQLLLRGTVDAYYRSLARSR